MFLFEPISLLLSLLRLYERAASCVAVDVGVPLNGPALLIGRVVSKRGWAECQEANRGQERVGNEI